MGESQYSWHLFGKLLVIYLCVYFTGNGTWNVKVFISINQCTQGYRLHHSFGYSAKKGFRKNDFYLGNKADCPEREVRKEDGERLAREYNVTFLETSAKTGLNVELAFLTVAK